ncbi:tyrosine-type recombinase/integrase [Myxococcota bacterium]|nr:tyrosine-type recombinase/integrase [Myxococcota bacterium]
MNARPPPDDREAKEGAPDEILIAPPEDRDPPDDPPGQKTADPKEDPTSSKSKKKAPSRKRFRLEQDPGGPVEAPGETAHLDSEAPMNALSPTRAKKATSTQAATSKPELPQRVTKPEVQRHHNLSATVVRGPKVEHGEVRWYWRIDRCANAALGVTERETVFHKWATVTEAQSELADLVIRGAHRPQKAFAGQRIVTFADLIKADEAAQGEPAHLSPRTVQGRVSLRRSLTKLLGHKAVVQTDKAELERIFTGAIGAGRAHLTVTFEAGFLLRAWRWAFEERLVAVKPPKLELGRVKRDDKLTPNRAQINAILQALKGEARLIVEVLASTGARIGEIVLLRRCDYDPQSHLLTVDGKTGPRRIPIDETLRERLAARADGSTSPLFHWGRNCKAQATRFSWVRDNLARVCSRLNMPSFTPHSLRRAAVHFYITLGYDPKTLSALLGHSVKVMMEYYRTPTPEQVEQMVVSARPGDFSQTSSARRKALEVLPGLLKDEAMMADKGVRDAVTLVLNSLGKSISGDREPSPHSAGPATDGSSDATRPPQDVPRPVARRPETAPALTVDSSTGPTAPTRSAPPAHRGGQGAPASQTPTARPVSPSAAASPRPAVRVAPTRPTPPEAAPRSLAVRPPTATGGASSLRSAVLDERLELKRAPPRVALDKLTKG